ncbi:GNAT family N-acetyltransferase [Gloeocapsopsis dulcis]|uniref:GNAT family N-acetyltransferase n=1 Tax=Gloeocapsopsis dulcis AAB1 = 1H9 TaxID=1433147 RepID=A0A6N8FV72_9CHRO|nr:GNAT family N-acetyltransferase [Gloeocapsopsis dulcis]MUL36973.1 GNAT family N-acetyltransferase [Gloeocapsopsis dulcis AAB1 = 1H9]WNN88790.1 GNAT family N-acetyltransferase [Gloeocapsopsis dulcis]
MSAIAIKTHRLILRELTLDDLEGLAQIYADPVVMKYYPNSITREETKYQITRMINGYQQRGWGLWATIHKADNKFIGRCGLIPQIVDGCPEVEIGYLLAKEYWGKGLATEAARAIRDYGFGIGCDRLISLIAPGNIASQKVATKTGLCYEKDVIFRGKTVQVYAIASS